MRLAFAGQPSCRQHRRQAASRNACGPRAKSFAVRLDLCFVGVGNFFRRTRWRSQKALEVEHA